MDYNPASEDHRVSLAVAIRETLLRAKFQHEEKAGCNEELYTFPVTQVPGVKICVYSTIVTHMVTHVPQVRTIGSDAIRVTVVYERKDGRFMQLFKASTINRVGQLEEIPQRTLKQMRKAFSTLKERSVNGYVCRCGAPMFDSKTGKKFCAETCWVTSSN